MKSYAPQRIVCLTEETVDLLYQIGEEDRIVGLSGFCNRPARAKKEKPVISTFVDGEVEAIMDLQPDLVLGFSDIQANLARDLIAAGANVWIQNYRSVSGILGMMQQLGTLVEKPEKTQQLIADIRKQISTIESEAETWTRRPKVYFEEWHDPMITGIQWVTEIITAAGGEEIFPELYGKPLARDRIIADPTEVARRAPDLILASWCGKKVKPEKMRARRGWAELEAVKHNRIYEIPSDIILQPGPAALQEALPWVHEILKRWNTKDFPKS